MGARGSQTGRPCLYSTPELVSQSIVLFPRVSPRRLAASTKFWKETNKKTTPQCCLCSSALREWIVTCTSVSPLASHPFYRASLSARSLSPPSCSLFSPGLLPLVSMATVALSSLRGEWRRDESCRHTHTHSLSLFLFLFSIFSSFSTLTQH